LLDSDQDEFDNEGFIEQRDNARGLTNEQIIEIDPPFYLNRAYFPSKNSTQLPEIIGSPEIEEILTENSKKYLEKMSVCVLALIPDWHDVRFNSQLELTITGDPDSKAQLFFQKKLVGYVDNDISLLDYFIKRNMIELKINKASEPTAMIKVFLLDPQAFVTLPEQNQDDLAHESRNKKKSKSLSM